MQNGSDSHASDETCSHGKNVDATVWLGCSLVFIMSLIVCAGGQAGLRKCCCSLQLGSRLESRSSVSLLYLF